MEYQTESEFNELLALYKSLPQRRRVLEIGSMMGDTLREWMKHGDLPMTLISVDKIVPSGDSRYRAQMQAHEDWFKLAVEEAAKLVVIDDFSQSPDTIAKVRSALGGGALDFLFIDGGHDYETVKADYQNYSPLVRPGGVIAFHDIQGIADVNRFWNEIKKTDEMAGQEICHPNGWGIGVIQKPDDRPVLHVVTPCSRPENLPKLADSLDVATDFFRVTWWIVTDGRTVKDLPNAKHFPDLNVKTLVCRAKENVAGKAQINLALDKITDGWVWVLDDDNTAHPEFFRKLYQIQNPRCAAVAFAQVNRQGGVRSVGAESVKECSIDQAQFVLRRELIGDERYLQKYTADGEFAERVHKKGGLVWEFCNEPFTHYNWLKP
jgi:glycosyltransferase involved in cell wall biosynthesis